MSAETTQSSGGGGACRPEGERRARAGRDAPIADAARRPEDDLALGRRGLADRGVTNYASFWRRVAGPGDDVRRHGAAGRGRAVRSGTWSVILADARTSAAAATRRRLPLRTNYHRRARSGPARVTRRASRAPSRSGAHWAGRARVVEAGGPLRGGGWADHQRLQLRPQRVVHARTPGRRAACGVVGINRKAPSGAFWIGWRLRTEDEVRCWCGRYAQTLTAVWSPSSAES